MFIKTPFFPKATKYFSRPIGTELYKLNVVSFLVRRQPSSSRPCTKRREERSPEAQCMVSECTVKRRNKMNPGRHNRTSFARL